MSEWRFSSADKRYGLILPDQVVHEMLSLCVKAKACETGGILVGRYTEAHDAALVTAVSAPPPDSKAGLSWFIRGVRGLQRWLDSLWRSPQRTYYLGEWHFHPGAPPVPSGTDRDQMAAIAKDPKYHCPEPILLIVGGASPEWEVKAFVMDRGSELSELVRNN